MTQDYKEHRRELRRLTRMGRAPRAQGARRKRSRAIVDDEQRSHRRQPPYDNLAPAPRRIPSATATPGTRPLLIHGQAPSTGPRPQPRAEHALVERIPQGFARLKLWDLGGLDLDGFAGPRVAAGAGCTAAYFERAESDQGHALLFLEAGPDRRQRPFQGSPC